jgi:phage gp29-like protein
MGFQVSQVIWDTDQDVWMPSLQTWHPTLSFFRNDTRTYVANAVEGQLHVIPGNGQWSLYTPYGYYRGWLQGAVRAISLPWLCRQYALRDWARYSEAHGLPIKKVYVPSQAEAIDKDNFFTAIASLSNESAVMIPRAVGNDTDGGNYDLQLLEATANTWEGFQGLITKCETRMAIRMLGQNLTTEVDAGSLAAASVHERIRLDYVKADAKSMASALVESIIKPFCRFNYGDDLCAPEFEWNTDPIEDKVEKATVVANIASAMYSFAQAGVPVDQRALLKLVGVPVLEEGVPAPGPIAPQPAPPTVVPNDIIPPGGAGPKGTPPGPKPPGFVPPPPMPSKDAARTKTELLGEKLEATHPGRTFSQELADAGQDAGRAAMRAHVSDVLEAVNAATTVDELRGALSAIAKSQEPGALGRLVENSLILGELSGRYSVTQEK